jgi:hypothetical protein
LRLVRWFEVSNGTDYKREVVHTLSATSEMSIRNVDNYFLWRLIGSYILIAEDWWIPLGS